MLSNSCKEKYTSTQIIISGRIVDYKYGVDEELITFLYDDYIEDRLQDIVQINESGEFVYIVSRLFPQEFMVKYGSLFSIITSPGDSLHLDIDRRIQEASKLNLSKFDLVTVTGSGSQLNSDYLNYFKYYSDSIFDFYTDLEYIKEGNPSQFTDYIINRSVRIDSLSELFLDKNNSSDEFKEWLSIKNKYTTLNDLLRYRWTHPHYNDIEQDSLFKFPIIIPDEYFDFLGNEKAGNMDAVITSSYYNFMHEFFMHLIFYNKSRDSIIKERQLLRMKDYESLDRMRVTQIIENTSDFACDLFLSKVYYGMYIKSNRFERYEFLRDEYPITNEALTNILQAKYVEAKEIYENPKLSEGSKINNISHNSDASIIDTIASRFKGKVLYIDFWAPWCSPCISEMPYSKKLQFEFTGKDVVFIYLANRCTEESWKATISTENILGEHFLLDEEQYKKLALILNITGIPHYLLVDKSGNIVNNDAPRPSHLTELKSLINKLL